MMGDGGPFKSPHTLIEESDEKKPEKSSAMSTRCKHTISAVLLVVMVVTWVAQNEIAQITEQSNDTSSGNSTNSSDTCDQPLVIVWFNHVLLIVFLPVGLMLRKDERGQRLSLVEAFSDFLSGQKSIGGVLGSSAILTIIYNAGNFAWYFGAPLTTISVANAIFNSQMIFTAFFGICILRECLRWWQFCSMAIMFGGVFCVTFWTRDGEFTFPDFVASFGSFSGPVVGDMLMLLAAVLFGLYEVVYKKLAGADESVSTSFVFIGLIGLWDLLLFAWCPIVSHFFMAPIGDMFGGACVGGFLLQAFLSALFNSIFMVCIYLTSPTIVAITWVTDIPLAFIVDALFRGEYYCGWQIAGGCLVGLGFVLFVLPFADIHNRIVQMCQKAGNYGLLKQGDANGPQVSDHPQPTSEDDDGKPQKSSSTGRGVKAVTMAI